METIKVNMNPNPLDVQTIHASQNDGEARQWEFELHNNGELIDTSEITEQLVFKAYKGGTEQLLPENGSTPTTSPFKGDIRYPQGLLTDQEFTYRQSPTEEDGLAKITDIKGNTLNWNQQVETLITTQDYEGVTFTNNGDGSLTINGTTTNTSVKHPSIVANNVGADGWKASHRYYIELNNTSLQPLLVRWGTSTESAFAFARRNTEDSNSTRYLINGANIGSPLGDGVGGLRFRWNANVGLTFNNAKIIPQIFDLTEMFGTEKAEEIYQMEVNEVGSGVAYFRSLFPLSYYSYNQGSLLSFMGNGIKTVGFNQWDGETESGYIYNGITYASNDYWRTKNYIPVIANKTYFFNVPSTQGQIALYDANKNYVSSVNSMGGSTHLVTIPSGCAFARFYQPISSDSSTVCVNISSNRNGEYEPYTSSTLSLPISTYFPTGMKSARNVYDELTESKATKRTEKETYTTSTGWSTRTTGSGWRLFERIPSDIKNVGTAQTATIKNNRFEWNTNLSENNTIRQVNTTITVRKDDITSLADWGTYLASNPLEVIYELATPTETPITTASLVTENAEIPLSNNDGVLIGKCTEELSAEPGFHDAKIKLSDSDGTCYSNKLQLHIERSPQ